MGYTCKDCMVQCIERSREYICTSFKLGDPTDSAIWHKKAKGNKKYTQKPKGCYKGSENVLKGEEND